MRPWLKGGLIGLSVGLWVTVMIYVLFIPVNYTSKWESKIFYVWPPTMSAMIVETYSDNPQLVNERTPIIAAFLLVFVLPYVPYFLAGALIGSCLGRRRQGKRRLA